MTPRVVLATYVLLTVVALVAAFGAGAGVLHPAVAAVCIAPSAIPWVAGALWFTMAPEDRRGAMSLTCDMMDEDEDG